MFSSHERLRLALAQQQQHAYTPRPSFNHTRNMSTTSVFSRSRPSHDSCRANSTRTKLRKPQPSAHAFVLSQGDAQWFLDLPDTIKRKHFTREEQILLAGKCQNIIMDATDETLFRMGRQANRSNDTIDTTSTLSPRSSGDHDADWRNSFRWMDESDDLDLRLNLDEYHESIMQKAPPATPTSAQSRRRTFSLTSKQLRNVVTPANSPPPVQTRGRRSTSYSNSNHRPPLGHHRNSATIEPEAAYYQDPEARLKLRVYLASAQKFDEAIEFGFPSGADTKELQNGRLRNAPHNLQNRQTFRFQDDSFLLDDYDGRHEDNQLRLENTNAPQAPKDFPLPASRPSTAIHRPTRAMTSPYPVSSPGSREMTLRMTLTRPDLRADEKLLYGWKKDEPLPLETLPPICNDQTAPVGPYDCPWSRDSSDTGIVKKIWRKVKRQQRR